MDPIWAGYIGTTIIFISIIFDKSKVSKYISIAGCVVLTFYGIAIQVNPIWVLNLGCFVLYVLKLNFGSKFRPGCIIIGYQGIGKSSLAALDTKYIDLESGSFWIGDTRDPNWYQIYCKIAIELAIQGYIVFTSSHLVVREYLTSVPLPEQLKVFTCCPSIELKYLWIEKLKLRYNQSKLNKDYKSYMNAFDCYEDNIRSIQECPVPNILLTSMKYNLKKEIQKAIKQYK